MNVSKPRSPRPKCQRRDSRAWKELLRRHGGHRPAFIARQRERGRLGGILSGEVRRDRSAEIDWTICAYRHSGISVRQTAARLGVGRGKIQHVLKRDYDAWVDANARLRDGWPAHLVAAVTGIYIPPSAVTRR
ncbi:MAG: hypothetical protein OXM62_05705 [bacterium]|nr:hypothetical protein [bacterium]MDE0234482.1 hypothetical protein [bacterium]